MKPLSTKNLLILIKDKILNKEFINNKVFKSPKDRMMKPKKKKKGYKVK